MRVQTATMYSHELHDVVKRMMAPDPNDRPSAADLLKDLCTGDCRTIHGVDWEKVMDDKVQSLDSGVADTEKRMKRADGAFRAFDVDGSGSLDVAELIGNRSEIGKTMKLKYTPSDDEIRLVSTAAGSVS